MESNPHTRMIYFNAVDNNNKLRNIALMYRMEDGWFSDYGGQSDDEQMNSNVIRLIKADKNIVGFQSEVYQLENGVYKHVRRYYPSLSR